MKYLLRLYVVLIIGGTHLQAVRAPSYPPRRRKWFTSHIVHRHYSVVDSAIQGSL